MKRKKLLIVVIALASSLITLLSQETLAYYATVGESVNIITTGEVKIHVVEKYGDSAAKDGVSILPGSIVAKSVSVKNIGEHPCWLRIKLTNAIADSDLCTDITELNINLTDWIDGNDGYYYYVSPLAAGCESADLFTTIRIAGSVGNDYIGKMLKIIITAYAVQSENNSYDSPLDIVGWPAES